MTTWLGRLEAELTRLRGELDNTGAASALLESARAGLDAIDRGIDSSPRWFFGTGPSCATRLGTTDSSGVALLEWDSKCEGWADEIGAHLVEAARRADKVTSYNYKVHGEVLRALADQAGTASEVIETTVGTPGDWFETTPDGVKLLLAGGALLALLALYRATK